MANIVCKKCGATAISKCYLERSVFLTNDFQGLLEAVMDIREVHPTEDSRYMRVDMMMGRNDTLAETTAKLLHHLDNMTHNKNNGYPSIEQFLCDHDWEFMPGEHCSIGCATHKGLK